MNRLVASALTLLLLGACSSSSSAASQPEDEFLDKVEAACRTAGKQIDKLDAGDPTAVADLYDIVSGTADDLNQIDAPKAISKDYEAYTSNIDDQVAELERITTALAAGDVTAQQDAVNQLDGLRADSDGFVNALSIISCRGLVPRDGLVAATTDTTPDTTPETTPDTTTPDTPISIDTTPVATTPDTTASTETPTTVAPDDLSVIYNVPTGYTWTDYAPADVSGLYTNSVIGDLVTYYGGGELRSDADSSTATVYVVTLSADFTPESTASYQYWENVENGTDTTTPGGLAVRQELGAFTDTDCVVYVSGPTGVTICVFSGYDALTLMDTWVATNPL